jgi:DNA-binding response OmpR family regulator
MPGPPGWYQRVVSRILIAEDSQRLARFVEKGLEAAGYATAVARDGVEAAEIARDADFDLVILDIGLPRQDGFAVLRQLRARGERLPVLVLTARHLVEDVTAALGEGADDYLTKPFAFDELLARVRARLRTDAVAATVLVADGLELDLVRRSVSLAGEQLVLTAKELRLLETFMRRRGEALSRDELLSHVWGFGSEVGSNVVDVYVSYLRRKLGPERFETVRGYGYRMPG